MITFAVHDERDHVHEHTDEEVAWSNGRDNVPPKHRRLLTSLESNPQFFTPLEQSQQQQQQSLEASSVFGLLFNVRSKVDERIQITGFEFYTTEVERILYYQLYTKEGEYWETTDDGNGVTVNGGVDTYELISQGTIQGSSDCTDSFEGTALYCKLAVVPDEVFIDSKWTISEKLESRSFYFTLASKHLVVQGIDPTQQQQQRAGDRVVASTPELDLYGGIGTNAFPVTSDSAYLYGTSLGFVGKIHYDTDGDAQLVPGLAPPPTTEQPTQSPTTSSPTTSSPTTKTSTPTTAATQQPTLSAIAIQTLPTVAPQSSPPTQEPTTSPTTPLARPKCRPGRPCLTQPEPDDTEDSANMTSVPTTSPAMTIRTIVYIENTPGRRLEKRDIDKYIEVVTKFLDRSTLKDNGVTPMNITVVNDDLVEEPDNKKKGAGRLGSSNKKKGQLPNDRTLSYQGNTSYSYSYNEQEDPYVPKIYPAIFVQTEFFVMSDLPYDVAAFYLWNEFRTYEEELLTQFHDNTLFVSYFRNIQNVTVQIVNELIAPTAAPTIFVANTTIVASENSAQQGFEDIWLYLGITVGIVWLILTCCSLRHILNHRRSLAYRDNLKRLTNQMSFGSRNRREIITATMMSPRKLFNRLSSFLIRSRHPSSSDEENSPADGESIGSNFD